MKQIICCLRLKVPNTSFPVRKETLELRKEQEVQACTSADHTVQDIQITGINLILQPVNLIYLIRFQNRCWITRALPCLLECVFQFSTAGWQVLISAMQNSL